MLAGKSFYEYGFGQAIGGATNDFGSFIYSGGTALNLSNMMSNLCLRAYVTHARKDWSSLYPKLNLVYIHNNPVEYGLCEVPWEYKYSSATNYAGMKSLLDVILLSL